MLQPLIRGSDWCSESFSCFSWLNKYLALYLKYFFSLIFQFLFMSMLRLQNNNWKLWVKINVQRRHINYFLIWIWEERRPDKVTVLSSLLNNYWERERNTLVSLSLIITQPVWNVCKLTRPNVFLSELRSLTLVTFIINY